VEGNLIYRKTARNFNPAIAMAGKVTVAEVEQVVEITDLAVGNELNLPSKLPIAVLTLATMTISIA
jgi:acyl CoA:acetate/3-ketoacid CoA transferase alpha subunit